MILWKISSTLPTLEGGEVVKFEPEETKIKS